eukprot:1149865-Pelagomonas_calceolata.AAC.7
MPNSGDVNSHDAEKTLLQILLMQQKGEAVIAFLRCCALRLIIAMCPVAQSFVLISSGSVISRALAHGPLVMHQMERRLWAHQAAGMLSVNDNYTVPQTWSPGCDPGGGSSMRTTRPLASSRSAASNMASLATPVTTDCRAHAWETHLSMQAAFVGN